MAPSGSSSSTQGGPAPNSSSKDSNKWTTIKPGVVLGLKATEMALDGLPIPGLKGCVSLILHIVNTTDLTLSNAEALEALQSRLNSLQEVLSPIYVNHAGDVPASVQKDVGNLTANLDRLAVKWKLELEKKPRKRDFVRRMFNAEDDRVGLTKFANAVEQAIQDFLVISTTNGRIAASREELKHQQARLLDRLPRATAASYKCVRTGGASTCLKGTRVSILKTIEKWATNLDPGQPPIFWLNGLAGIGKTTIAHTIAFELDGEGFLGASFVFLRADDHLKDARLVVPTLAFQLAQYNSHFRAALVEVLEQDPDCDLNSLDLQFQKLILRPFSILPLSTPVVLILDALDECEPEKLTSELLRLLLNNIQSVPLLRVLITSRPEGYIREALDLVDGTSPHQKLVLHEDVHAEEVEDDIRLFLQVSLQEIWNERTKRPSERWPTEVDLANLVQQSGKIFVYAAIAIRFIGGNRALNLDRQLSKLLNVKIGHIPNGQLYRELDGLYSQILESALADSSDEYYVHRFRKVVGSIALLERPLPLGSLANFLGDYSIEEIRETLYHLHSIMIIPTTGTEPARSYHLSFPDFITNSDRCTNPRAYIDPGQQAKYLFFRCLAIMEKDFHSISNNPPDRVERSPASYEGNTVFIVADLLSSAEQLDSVDRPSDLFHSSVDDEIDSEDFILEPEVRYADNYWCRHLMNIPTGDQEAALALQSFIVRHLPSWLQRRENRLRNKPCARLIRDTFDIMRDAHRWGTQSRCDDLFQRSLRQSAQQLYAKIFPNARVEYVLGRRLNLRNIVFKFGEGTLIFEPEDSQTSTSGYSPRTSFYRCATNLQISEDEFSNMWPNLTRTTSTSNQLRRSHKPHAIHLREHTQNKRGTNRQGIKRGVSVQRRKTAKTQPLKGPKHKLQLRADPPLFHI